MTRIRADYAFGNIDTALTTSDTTLSSPELAALPAVSSPDVSAITLYDAASGIYEILHVTAHAASATTATVTRAQEGSTAGAWSDGATWLHGPTATDFTDTETRLAALEGGGSGGTMVWAGAYDLASAYSTNDVVRSGSALYIATANKAAGEAPNPSPTQVGEGLANLQDADSNDFGSPPWNGYTATRFTVNAQTEVTHIAFRAGRLGLPAGTIIGISIDWAGGSGTTPPFIAQGNIAAAVGPGSWTPALALDAAATLEPDTSYRVVTSTADSASLALRNDTGPVSGVVATISGVLVGSNWASGGNLPALFRLFASEPATGWELVLG